STNTTLFVAETIKIRRFSLIGVHHMHAHILAHFIDDPKPEFPFLCLTVSGGHTQLVLVRSPLDMEVIGHTIDDAAGEAFDKAGKMLGLPYPAGPVIDKLAQNGQPKFSFSIAQIPGYDFSFSGFKTSVLYFLQIIQVIKGSKSLTTNMFLYCFSGKNLSAK
ncbi:MAG: hypothetical protein RL675_357, partial [Bacteroidota bacterium]